MGFSRQEDWRRLPCPSAGHFPDAGVGPGPPAQQADSLPSELPGKRVSVNPQCWRTAGPVLDKWWGPAQLVSVFSLLSLGVRSWGAPAHTREPQPESLKAIQLLLMDSLLLPFMSNELWLLLGFRWDPSSPIASFFDHSVCFIHHLWHWSVFPGSSISKESACQCRRHRRHGFDPWVGKVPWRKKWQPTAVFLPGKSHGQKSLVGYSPWGHERVGHDLSTKPPPWHWSQTWILLASYFKACVVWITKSVGMPLILFVSYWHTAWGRGCPVSVAPLMCIILAHASPSLLSAVWDKEGVSPSVQVRMRLPGGLGDGSRSYV